MRVGRRGTGRERRAEVGVERGSKKTRANADFHTPHRARLLHRASNAHAHAQNSPVVMTLPALRQAGRAALAGRRGESERDEEEQREREERAAARARKKKTQPSPSLHPFHLFRLRRRRQLPQIRFPARLGRRRPHPGLGGRPGPPARHGVRAAAAGGGGGRGVPRGQGEKKERERERERESGAAHLRPRARHTHTRTRARMHAQATKLFKLEARAAIKANNTLKAKK